MGASPAAALGELHCERCAPARPPGPMNPPPSALDPMRRPHPPQGPRQRAARLVSFLAMGCALGLPRDAVAARAEITVIASKVEIEHRLEADGLHIRATDAPRCGFARD